MGCFSHILSLIAHEIIGHQSLKPVEDFFILCNGLFANSNLKSSSWIEYINSEIGDGANANLPMYKTYMHHRWLSYFEHIQYFAQYINLGDSKEDNIVFKFFRNWIISLQDVAHNDKDEYVGVNYQKIAFLLNPNFETPEEIKANKKKHKKKFVNQSAADPNETPLIQSAVDPDRVQHIKERKILCENYFSGLVAIMAEVIEHLSCVYKLLKSLESKSDKHGIVYLYDNLLEVKKVLLSRSNVKNKDESENYFCNAYAAGLQTFEKYWKRHSPFLQACAIFDPRYLKDHAEEWKNTTFEIFCKQCPVAKCFTTDHSLKLDFNRYLACATHPSYHEPGFNLAEYWNNNEKFPKLSELANVIINMPCVSVAAERSFSMFRWIFGDRQQQMSENLLIASHSLQFNLPSISQYCELMKIPFPF